MTMHLGSAKVSLFDPELLAALAALLVVLGGGGLAIRKAYRWYRTLKQPLTNSTEDLDQFVQTLQAEGELEPEEIQRLRAALERQKKPPA